MVACVKSCVVYLAVLNLAINALTLSERCREYVLNKALQKFFKLNFTDK